MVDCDVLIVGAGPAGCAAAISAQRLGLKSIVVDKAEFPRDKCCGDGLTAMALREIEGLGLRPTAASWTSVTDVWLKSPFGKTIKLDLPEDGQYAAIVKREDLDFDLLGDFFFCLKNRILRLPSTSNISPTGRGRLGILAGFLSPENRKCLSPGCRF